MYDIKYHLVWVTKYRYKVLVGELALRTRDVIRQACMAREVKITKGHVSRDHVHLFVSSPPGLLVSQIVQYVKGKSSYVLQQEFPELKRRYWGRHLWARGYFCATVGQMTEEMIKQYLEHHFEPNTNDNFKMEPE